MSVGGHLLISSIFREPFGRTHREFEQIAQVVSRDKNYRSGNVYPHPAGVGYLIDAFK